MPFTVNLFTWCNNQVDDARIYERLDRIVVNSACLSLFPFLSLNNLPIHDSDHGPICLTLNPNITKRKRTFKLEAMRLNHPNFHNIVSKAWSTHVVGNSVQNFVAKASACQNLAKTWNISVFGNMLQRMKDLHLHLQSIQSCLNTSKNYSDLTLERQLALFFFFWLMKDSWLLNFIICFRMRKFSGLKEPEIIGFL